MDEEVYKSMIYDQDHHWWFKGRKLIIKKLADKFIVNGERILEVGCGTGGNLRLLREYGSVTAVESHLATVRFVEQVFGSEIDIRKGSLPNDINLDGKYNSICCFDVLEHIENDVESLRAMGNLLAPDGKILITVPCYQFLYSRRDEMLGHYRRYTYKTLNNKIKEAGLRVTYYNHFMFLLFPLALLSLLIEGARSSGVTQLHNYKFNSILYWVFKVESLFFDWISFPFGLSLALKVEKIQ